jgi:hypothetical protein
LVRWASRAGTREFCSALAALVRQVQNIFFLTVYYFNFFFPIGQQAGPPVVHGRLSLSMFLWLPHCLRAGNVLTNRDVLPKHTQHMTKTIMKSSFFPSHGIAAFKSQFHNVNVLEFLNNLWGLGTK